MDADLKKLKKLTKFMRDNGVLSVKTAEIEMSLAPQALFPVEQAQQVEADTSSDIISKPLYTDQEILLWSSPGHNPEIEETH